MYAFITGFQESMLADAAALLAMRHQRHRAAQPLLPHAFEEPEALLKALAALESEARESGGSSAAAIKSGRLEGFMIGRLEMVEPRGHTAWVPLLGHALAPDAPADLYRDLYAYAAPAWLERGCFAHHLVVPAHDRAALEAWSDTGFGKEQVHAIRALTRTHSSAPPQPPHGIMVRRAEPSDREALRDVAHLIAHHQACSPTWAAVTPEYLAEIAEGYADAASDEAATYFLALRGQRVLAFQGYYPAEAAPEDMLTPPGCVELSVAATRPEERGRGLMRLLTAHGLAAARSAGFRVCTADWRATNLLASRFWPIQGFEPTAYRLTRCVNPRIAWAH